MAGELLLQQAREPAKSVEAPPTFAPFERDEIEQSIGGRFEKVAATNPERAAVREPAGVCSYAALDAAANRVARALLSGLPRGSEPVALFFEAGASLFAAMLGTLKSGRCYVPLDPNLPVERLRAIFRALDACVLLTDAALLPAAESLAGTAVPVWRADRISSEGPSTSPGLPVSPDALAYVLFTSGSTGSSKGVMQSHRNVLHNVMKLTNGLRIGPDDRLTLLSSPSFGASVSDIFGALLNGAAVCPFSVRGDGLRRLPEFLEREGITIYHSVPSVFRAFAATLGGGRDLPRLRLLKLGGEPVLASDFELYRGRFSRDCVFHVGLGSTEMGVMRQWFAGHDTPWPGAAPLGYAVDGTEIVLLDEQGRHTAGEGEIGVIAATLPVGYWRDPVRTAEAFLAVPGRPGVRLYRSGDIGRQLPDGCLLHVGRKDSLVKVRGLRVDLEEVERSLASLPGVREAAVTARLGPGGVCLAAHVASETAAGPGVVALRRALSERLPDHMIPSSFVFLGALPRTPTGKIDREALPPPEPGRPRLETGFVEPRDDAEEAVARVFAEVLTLDRVGAEDDFFALGGSSLSGIEALALLSARLGTELAAADLLEAPTPAALAARALRKTAALPGGLVRLQRGERPGRPVFLVPGGAGDGEDLLVGARLARRVDPAVPFFGFRSGPAPHPSVEELARRHAARMRAAAPAGPYLLVGECVGGILALEIARRLREQGERVALLALLDTPFPTRWRRLLHALRWLRAPWGDNLWRRARHHRQALRALDRSGRRAYAAEKARAAARALLPSRRAADRPLRQQRASYVGRLLSAAPEPFGGPIHLVESEEGRRQALSAAWSRVSPQVAVAQVPGDHATYIRDHVDRVATILRQWLSELSPPGEG
ncbi:MAG: AMP-binding protein [Acidobacteriota bacterium]